MFKWIKRKEICEYEKVNENIKELEDKVGSLNKLVEQLNERYDNIYDEVEELRRIITYSNSGELATFKTTYRFVDYSFHKEFCTYIYKNNKEYKIKNLRLSNPVFSETEKNNVLNVRDEYKTLDQCKNKYNIEIKEYVIDLDKKTYIVTRDEEVRLKSIK